MSDQCGYVIALERRWLLRSRRWWWSVELPWWATSHKGRRSTSSAWWSPTRPPRAPTSTSWSTRSSDWATTCKREHLIGAGEQTRPLPLQGLHTVGWFGFKFSVKSSLAPHPPLHSVLVKLSGHESLLIVARKPLITLFLLAVDLNFWLINNYNVVIES